MTTIQRIAIGFCCIGLLLLSHFAWAVPVIQQQRLFQAGMDQPTAVSVAASGQVFVLDGVNRRVLALAADGSVSRQYQPGLDGALALWAGSIDGQSWLLIADTGHHRLIRLEPSSARQTIIPLSDATGSVPPEPVAVTVIDDTIYWADRTTQRVCRLRWQSGETLPCFGGRGEQNGRFQYPGQMAVDRDGYLHVTDILNARIQVFDKTGRFFSRVGRFGLSDGELYRPTGLALDAARDRLYLSDAYFGHIQVFERGEYRGLLRDEQGQPLQLDTPSGLAFQHDTLYVAETGASRVVRLRLTETPDRPAEPDGHPVALSQKNCIQCHLSWASEAPAAVRDRDADGILPEASFRMCYSCHQGPVMDSRTRIHRAAQHPTLYESAAERQRHARLGPRQDKLPRDFPLDAHQRLTCTSCHTPHTDTAQAETLYAGHGNAWLRVPNRGGDLCERCHASKGREARPDTAAARQGHNHPLGLHLRHPPQPQASDHASQPELHRGLPDVLRQHGAVTGPEDTLICQSCHQIHGGDGDGVLTALPTARGELCGRCHERQTANGREEAHRKGIHPVNFRPEQPLEWRGRKITEINCGTCHPVHQGQVGTDLLPEGIASAEALCQGCHKRQHAENREQARFKGIHPVNVTLEEPVTLNGQRQETVTCLSCHAVHRGKPATAALVETDRNGELCSYCHAHKQTVAGTDHDLRITAKTSHNAFDQTPAQSGLCGTCHSLHRGRAGQRALSAVKPVAARPASGQAAVDETPFERDRLCLNCHQTDGLAADKTIRHFSHPSRGLILRSTDPAMPLLDDAGHDATLGRIGCVTCHEPHVFDPRQHKTRSVPAMQLSTNTDNLEGTHSDSFLHHQGISGTFCVNCHGQEGLIKYQYYHDATRARGKPWDE